jgi:hypothetical protein
MPKNTQKQRFLHYIFTISRGLKASELVIKTKTLYIMVSIGIYGITTNKYKIIC